MKRILVKCDNWTCPEIYDHAGEVHARVEELLKYGADPDDIEVTVTSYEDNPENPA